ncbi:PREDICTED: hemicentin-1-like isoform X4 [Branchiostoma belcheri]|uniref:Hemicentin-1-like isoform X4 n=1 Tax=Branchiostoma belcheri TaxID=7741 RepID=A0A6P4YW04_BRABE|nr:PREDICTED: hemicentin-1-like isoform X4 [Branchiostoma belcheri]
MLLRVCLALCLAVTVAAEDVSHERGQSHTFECTFPISADRYILNWMKNDESVMNYFTGDPAPTFTGDLEDRAGVSLVNRRNLEIQNLRISDEGEYYCSVSELGEGGQSGDGMRYQLVVYVPPTISVSGGPYEAEVGGKMMVTCRANSHPPSNFTWTSPLGEISHGAVLELTNMTTNDIGRYMCMANNGYGVASAYVDISMKERVVGGSDVMRATGLPIMLLLIASLLLPVFFS